MDGTDEHVSKGDRPRWRKKRWAIPGLSILVLLAVALVAWASRERIVDDLIQDQLAAYGIPATYEIQRIGGRTQIISDLVIGDPQSPDLTADRVVIGIRYRLGMPQVSAVTVYRPRLYGTFVDGKLSFGALDPIIFGEPEGPPGLPDIYLKLADGRGLIESDYGPIGVKMVGEGLLSGGFDGIVAAAAPELDTERCAAREVTLYGKLVTDSGAPEFSGPLRAGTLICADENLAFADIVAEIEAKTNSELANPSFTARLEAGPGNLGDIGTQSLAGTIRGQIKEDEANARYNFALRGAESPHVLAAVLTAEGVARARENFARIEIEGDVEGNGLRLGRESIGALESLAGRGEGTLLEPIARQIGRSIRNQTRGSSFAANLTYRSDGDGSLFLVPEARLQGGGGARLLSLSRFELAARQGEPARLSGNIATGGPGIPRISGRMERVGEGDAVFRLSMAPYAAGSSRIAIPGLTVAQGPGGILGFSGRISASGPLPGGSVEELSLPVRGKWGPGGQFAMWRECTRIEFRRLAFAELAIAGPGLTLCPPSGSAILRAGSGGMRFAAGAPSLDLRGSLGETPIRVESGPIGFSWPGTVSARNLDIALGPPATASRFTISDLDAKIGENIAGNFADADVRLDAVPLNIVNATGRWDYTGGKLSLKDASFRLLDREEPVRFEPLVARNASLTLEDNIVTALAALRHPASDRVVTTADIRHNLATGSGFADLSIDDLRFDEQLQPTQLSALALGVIANARGSVSGTGRIDWSDEGEVTSSGTFTTENLDFAASFGPVKGASGTIEFTDLLGLTTAPGQTLKVASVNPGIEVLDGEIAFELRNGELLSVAGGSWPFMGGRLILREVDLNLGVSEERRYIFEIVGLEAAQFVAQMELENISATGTFDGTVPIVFDAAGNGFIEEGILLSRAPGGNISYVGELTYEDLSAIANFAFDALRSLDYTQMRVIMEGPLTGEIVTRVRFDGVRQGEGAKTNFITRQIADLPLQFRINIRAQFYQLLTSIKSMYDPASVRDPRELGLLSDDGKRLLRRSISGDEIVPDVDPEDVIPDEPPIQDEESE